MEKVVERLLLELIYPQMVEMAPTEELEGAGGDQTELVEDLDPMEVEVEEVLMLMAATEELMAEEVEEVEGNITVSMLERQSIPERVEPGDSMAGMAGMAGVAVMDTEDLEDLELTEQILLLTLA